MNTVYSVWKFTKPKIKYLFLILILINALVNYKDCYVNFLVIIAVDLGMIILTYFGFNKVKVKQYTAILILIFASTFIWSSGKNGDFISIYYFILMDTIFDCIHDFKQRVYLIIAHFIGFSMKFIVRALIGNRDISRMNMYDIIFYTMMYIIVLAIYVIIHIRKDERDRLKQLNDSLIEYSFKEKEYLISKERSRISQELHDSLGHSLMALSMNVRYAKAINGKKDISNEIEEIEKLVKESINTLRSTVYSLKQLDKNYNLHEEIKAIISKFNDLDMIEINLDYDDDIEKASIEMKNIILTTIKEAITNSLKHGNAKEINISIELSDNDIRLNIKDDGQGCGSINKSNGLSGITERFEKVHGNVEFISGHNKGFTIKAMIPGGILYDQNYDS